MILEILKEPNPILREKCLKIDKITPEIVALAKNMLETMYQAPGVGLAASQTGYSIRMIVMDVTKERDESQIYINPEVVSHNNEKETLAEGCLCVPGKEGDVERFTKVTVKAMTLEGKKVTMKAEGFRARVFQHEIDHLDGILYIDRVLEGTFRDIVPGHEEEVEL